MVCDHFYDLHEQAEDLGIPDDNDTGEDLSMCRGVCWVAHFVKPPRKGASVARWVIAITPKADIEIVAHESTHAALSIAHWHRLNISGLESKQEELAYLVGWATRTTSEAIARYKNLTVRK